MTAAVTDRNDPRPDEYRRTNNRPHDPRVDDEPAGPQQGLSFADLNLAEPILQAIGELGFTSPTDIQVEAIPLLAGGRDVVGVAQTGTGKTAAFGLPLLGTVDPARREVQALVLAPTRELAMQVSEAIASFAEHLPGLRVLPIYGGASFATQLRGLRDGAQVVVGTPGRVIDLLDRGRLDLSDVGFLVLDEADEMLRMGFAEDVDQILSHVPSHRRTALFSATMPAAIHKVADTHLTNPLRLSMTPASPTVDTVRQTYAIVSYRNKMEALSRVLAVTEAEAAIVFVRTKAAAEEVTLGLTERGIPAAAISGDVAQRDRERLIERLRSGSLDVLVATDVAARGLDVERIGLVVNFDVPREAEGYVHRIGRTGRAGRSGEALSFVTPRQRSWLRLITKHTGSHLDEISIPSAADVARYRGTKLLSEAAQRREAGNLEVYRQLLTEHGAIDESEMRELAAALLAHALGDDGTADSDNMTGGETPTHPAQGRAHRDRPSRTRAAGGRRYRLDVGHRHGARPGAIVGALTGESELRGADVGKIDIFDSFTLVDVAEELSPQAQQRLGKARVAGRRLQIRHDTGAPKHRGHRGSKRDS